MNKLTIAQLVTFVVASSVDFTVVFTKKTTGELRKMHCKVNASKDNIASVVKRAEEDAANNVLTVVDLEKSAHRRINLAQLHTVQLNDTVYNWDSKHEVLRAL